IVYLKNEKIIDIDENSLIEPLDFLPIINRELFPSKDRPNPQIYWDGFCQNYPALQMQASRGCPYKCDFCLWNNVIYRNGKYRTFSIDRVITEMKILISKYNAKEIYFDDDDFTINKQFVSELCSAIIQNKLNIKWSCMADAVNLDERLIKLMADSGCIGVKIGIESANRQILKNLGKPIDIEKARKLADICLKYNIKLHTTFMLGLKNENLQTINETLDFIENLPVSSFQLSICSPFPGTKYYEYLKNNNFDIKMFDGKINADIQNSILKLLLNDCELQKLAKRLKYFSALWFLKKIFNFRWLLQFIRNIFRVVLGLGLNFFIFQVYSNLVDKIYSQKYREND
ncbi:MAG TPA: radical SAM protein, partial [bacterium]|nr:radical SAM protein [bacterium]